MQQIQYDEGGYINWTNADWVDGVSNKVKGQKPSAAGALGNYLHERVALGATRTPTMTAAGGAGGASREASPVLAFLGRRILGALVALFVASIVIFAGAEILPGDAASVVLGRNATPAGGSELNQRMHLDRPPCTQYADWLGGFVHGDLGDSAVGLAQGQKRAPIWPLISSPVKNSAHPGARSRRCS